ncbi:protein of unknown function [Methylorubrum extorquens DM4]|uniref:Uncharacterized protein n=1 Tax=Methylorubrum extorquens (strain DSM 6343 / CIP 106787 / DM4) TaxID=661410 RepID=C7C7W8_METED|nr:protein of unknown function [Methylorubrum extorquens DM4]
MCRPSCIEGPTDPRFEQRRNGNTSRLPRRPDARGLANPTGAPHVRGVNDTTPCQLWQG